MPETVQIDRLVLELPGVDQARARAIALGIAEGLAGADLAGVHEALSINVDAHTAASSERLAAEIVRQIAQRLG